MRKLLLAIVSVIGVIALASPAFAGAVIDKAAASLRNDPVYVDPGATTVLSPDAAARLRTQISKGSAAIYVAALPADVTGETNGNVDALPAALGQAIGKNGSVGVVTSKSFRAGASSDAGLAKGQAGELATLAFGAHKSQGPEAVLSDWITRVQAAVAKNRAATTAGTAQAKASKPHKSHPFLIGFLIFLGLVVIAVIIWLLVARSRKHQRFVAAKSQSDSQVSALGTHILSYSSSDDPLIAEASERYTWASSALDRATTIDDLEAVDNAVAEGLSAIRRYQRRTDPSEGRADIGDEPVTTKARKARQAAADETRAAKSSQRTDEPAPKNTTVINNYNGSGTDAYWYGGGYRSGRYYGPGYYSSLDFWDGVWLGEMIDRDRDNDRYEHEHANVGGGSDSGAQSESGGGDWDTSGSGGDTGTQTESGGSDWSDPAPSSGGGDYTPSPDPEPASYDPPSYDPPSYDPPSYDPPSYDSGGGGFDGGGGGGGGGDW